MIANKMITKLNNRLINVRRDICAPTEANIGYPEGKWKCEMRKYPNFSYKQSKLVLLNKVNTIFELLFF